MITIEIKIKLFTIKIACFIKFSALLHYIKLIYHA